MALSKAIGGAGQGAATGMAVGGPVGALIGGGLGLLGGLFGGGKSDQEKAAEQASQIMQNLDVASPEQRTFALDYLKSVGQLTPEMESAISQSDTGMKSITLDPAYKKAQMEALSRLQQQGTEGLNLSDQAAFNDINKQVAQEEQGRQGAILQNMAARGMGGSGAELAARLQSSQSAADRANTQGTNIAAEASKRALEAVMAGGQLAGTQQQADFARQSEIQQAQDAINRFNTANSQNVENANVGARNQAQQSNLDYAKALEQNRVSTNNAQKGMNSQAQLDTIAAQNAKQKDIANAKLGLGAAQDVSKQRDTAGYLGTLGGLAGAAGALNTAGAFDSEATKAAKKAKGLI